MRAYLVNYNLCDLLDMYGQSIIYKICIFSRINAPGRQMLRAREDLCGQHLSSLSLNQCASLLDFERLRMLTL